MRLVWTRFLPFWLNLHFISGNDPMDSSSSSRSRSHFGVSSRQIPDKNFRQNSDFRGPSVESSSSVFRFSSVADQSRNKRRTRSSSTASRWITWVDFKQVWKPVFTSFKSWLKSFCWLHAWFTNYFLFKNLFLHVSVGLKICFKLVLPCFIVHFEVTAQQTTQFVISDFCTKLILTTMTTRTATTSSSWPENPSDVWRTISRWRDRPLRRHSHHRRLHLPICTLLDLETVLYHGPEIFPAWEGRTLVTRRQEILGSIKRPTADWKTDSPVK